MLPDELFHELLDVDSDKTKESLRKPFTISYVQNYLLLSETEKRKQGVHIFFPFILQL